MITSATLLWVLASAPNDYFAIQVVDEATGRGVPLVELRTVNDISCYTDSNGFVAFHEPGLMNQKVFFHVRSHGYEYAKDGFGFRGKMLDVAPGQTAVLKIKRVNLAERLYRITGGGIYRDSELLDKRTPLTQPVLNGLVFGSDSVMSALYHGRLYWFWGDTNKPSYPLGNFAVPGATSKLPTNGGLDPDVGVDLDYFTDKTGFARPTAQLPGPGPTWINGLFVLKDGVEERMFANYVRIKGSFDVFQRGLVEFNDQTKQFEKRAEFDINAPLLPDGHTFAHRDDGVDYIYFATPYPLVRVRARPEDLLDADSYEGYTCFKEGSRAGSTELDRATDGTLQYGWKKRTALLTVKAQKALIKAQALKPEEGYYQLRDIVTGKSVEAHGGSVFWNAYRRRWIMIAVEIMGTSVLGEVWYAEAEAPIGPWRSARKIVTHDRYSFYNPKQHPLFDKEGGRFIYFEGTYTNTFSGNDDPTPRYNYNQVMYRLDLADERLRPKSHP